MSDLIPVRDIAKFGIVTDRDPYTLPVGAWSLGANVRFRNGKITRGPVFRNIDALSVVSPRFMVGFQPNSSVNECFIGYLSGQIFSVTPSSQTDVSITGYVTSNSEAQWSSARLADLIYINREDRVPWYLPSGSSVFAELPNWDSTFRAHIIRASNSILIAFNVTKGATNFPTMVLTSSPATAGNPPASWDYTNPATLATQNILAELQGGIVDAQTLHNDVYIYGVNETWRMVYVGGNDIWDYTKVFDNRGSINANCSIEVQGLQYVFGVDDIWVHDGITPKSIADGRVREFIFGSIDLSKSNRCFVAHNPALKEIHFCYVSGDQLTTQAFPGYSVSGLDGCNRQAVYNYADDTWTFDDVPYCYFADRANMDVVLTYATDSNTYANQGGTYQDQAASAKRPLCYVGRDTSPVLWAFDLVGTGSVAPFPVDTSATIGLTLENNGIDLDALGEDLPAYKIISTIYPQGRLGIDAQPVSFTVGGADYFTSTPAYGDPQTYDGNTLYQLDFNVPGRYLVMTITYPDYQEMTLTGFDLDLRSDGER